MGPHPPPGDLSALLATMPFAVGLGIVLEQASADEAVGRLDWSPELTTAGGAMHGGALMALADTVGAVCAYLGLPPGAGTATTSSSTSMLRGVRDGYVRATARPLHRGRSLVVVQTELVDADGRLVAQVTQHQAVLL
jgi:1,4-dihydroxy-2-naphthoyl-CoA hydrolase